MIIAMTNNEKKRTKMTVKYKNIHPQITSNKY